ncbi:hypothetical protein ITJ43_04450 [Microbacterium sp. VKM Ac-2870]|uniref:hypothetical protein n=1 Tax=Microbacterium sp. VKM Ac-2870 TaxID=2783825 RepID=UPI00188C531B|nr:hypothetical protein [Microbacterium sp. VKM Ac-2870]MBF4561379.1 hypothetical protein [Microbacterium sp. VKM Ac-2870]
MARVGGRNAIFAWVVGIGCAATVGVLAALAIPMIPASVSWVGEAVQRPATSTPAVADADAGGVPTTCAQLYDQALWAALRFTQGAAMTPSTDPPTTTAAQLVTALKPQVSLTCTWHADAGTVATTLATVPTDAGPIAASALPAAGFTCTSQGERTRCARTDGDLTETIEAGGGRWLSTSESGWHPTDYVSRTAKRVWG